MKLSEQLKKCADGHDYIWTDYWTNYRLHSLHGAWILRLVCKRCEFEMERPVTKEEHKMICKMENLEYEE